MWVLSLVLPRHFLLKFMYQDRKVSGHVLFCMSVRGEIWVLSLVLPRHLSLKFMYQDRRVSGHVLFCMSVRGGYEF
jgi:hypothetical protein